MNVRSTLPTLAVALCLASPVSAMAQALGAFGEAPALTLAVPPFGDQQIGTWLTTLDRLLSEADAAKAESADQILGTFIRRVQAGRLSPAQELRIVAHLDRRAMAVPGDRAALRSARQAIQTLTVGKKAPEISGTDLNGVSFRLSDYRGQVVALVFSAEWCGICRTLYPYERLMLELYKNWPFALLGVEAGSSVDSARRFRAEQGLTFRAWWDGPEGAITSSWNVGGLPAVYVVDGEGTIRFIDTRHEDLLKGVRQLLAEQTARADAARQSASISTPIATP
jgi:peroxiredoxin